VPVGWSIGLPQIESRPTRARGLPPRGGPIASATAHNAYSRCSSEAFKKRSFSTAEASNPALIGHSQLDQPGHVSGEHLLVDGILQCGPQHAKDVTDRTGRQYRPAAFRTGQRAAPRPWPRGIPSLRAALPRRAEFVHTDPDMRCLQRSASACRHGARYADGHHLRRWTVIRPGDYFVHNLLDWRADDALR
jgi:hypothetical protein